MDNVGISSYHPSQISSHSPKLQSIVKNRQKFSQGNNAISNFSPVSTRQPVHFPAKAEQSSSTQDRQSRSRDKTVKNSLVPHLYAEQRIRSRSISKDPQQSEKGSNKDLKKIIAFGRTTTVEVKNTEKNSTSSFSTNHSEISRLRKEVEHLRVVVNENKQLKKDMEQMRQTFEKSYKKNEREFASAIQEIQKEMKEMRSTMTKSVFEINSNLNKLELRIDSMSNPVKPIQEMSSFSKEPSDSPDENQRSRDALYSCLAPDLNGRIRQLADTSSYNRRNITEQYENNNRNQDKSYNRVMAKLNDKENFQFYEQTANRSANRWNNKISDSRNLDSIFNKKTNLPFNNGKNKVFATNQMIDLNESDDPNEDFSFN